MIIHDLMVLLSPQTVFRISELRIRSNGLRVRERKQRGRVDCGKQKKKQTKPLTQTLPMGHSVEYRHTQDRVGPCRKEGISRPADERPGNGRGRGQGGRAMDISRNSY